VKKWRETNQSINKRSYLSGFIEFCKEYQQQQLTKDDLVIAWQNLSQEQRDEYKRRTNSTCPMAVDQVSFNIFLNYKHF
jgi:hypothetical protein